MFTFLPLVGDPFYQDPFSHLTPALVTVHSEEEIGPAPLSLYSEKAPVSFQAKPLTSEGRWRLVKDREWLSLVINLIAITSLICLLCGSEAASYVPNLSLIGAPLYIYYVANDAKEHFGLMASAYKTARVADAFFWGGKGIGAVGDALSDILKALGGSITLFGLAQIPFTDVEIPIFLMALSTIGGTAQGWSLLRIRQALIELNEKERKNNTLKSLEELLLYIKGPIDEESSALEAKQYSNFHFSQQTRLKSVEERIEKLMASGRHILNEWDSTFEDPSLSDFEKIDIIIDLTDNLLAAGEKPGEFAEGVREANRELLELRDKINVEGQEISDIAHSEIHRKLSEQTLVLLCSVMTFIIGVLMLVYPNYLTAGYIVSLSTAVLGIIGIVYNKGISQENFLYIERTLGILQKTGKLVNI